MLNSNRWLHHDGLLMSLNRIPQQDSTPVTQKYKQWNCDSNVTIQMKATEQYFPVVLFIMLYKVVLTFESVDEILWCDHSNESYWAVLSCGTVYYAVQGGSNFWVCGWNPQVWLFKLKLMSSTFLGTVFYAVQGLTGLNPNIWPFKWKLN